MKGWTSMNNRSMVTALATLAVAGLTPASAVAQMQAEVRDSCPPHPRAGS